MRHYFAFIFIAFAASGCANSDQSPPYAAQPVAPTADRTDVASLPVVPPPSANVAPSPSSPEGFAAVAKTPATPPQPSHAGGSASRAVEPPAAALAVQAPATLRAPKTPRAARAVTGHITEVYLSNLQLFDADRNPIGSKERSALAISPPGLPVYAKRNGLFETEIDGRTVWVRDTQVAFLQTGRPDALPMAKTTDQSNALKGVSPGLR